jgi:transcriptional regulator with XRE-family HTH domain
LLPDKSVWQTCETMDGIPENVARRRNERGWSQQELARRADVNKETVNRLENGHGFTDKTLVAVARALHTTPARLRGDAEPKESSPELERLLFLFARLGVKARLALLATAEALLEMQQAGSAPP